MHSAKELGAMFRAAMEKKNFTPEALAKHLGVSGTMVDKFLCGDVVPSQHLQKQMIELLQIPQNRVRRIASKRNHSAKSKFVHEEKTRKIPRRGPSKAA